MTLLKRILADAILLVILTSPVWIMILASLVGFPLVGP